MLLGDKDLMVNEVGVQNEKWLVDRLVYDVRRFVSMKNAWLLV